MLGLWHEHQRPDREDYVTVDVDAARLTDRGEFTILPLELVDIDHAYADYDFGSMMHYEQYVSTLSCYD